MKYLSITILLAVFCWLYLDKPFIQDLNPEALDLPITVYHLQQAHKLKLSPHEYFNLPQWNNYRTEAGGLCNNYPRGRFQFEWFGYQTPFIVINYPFVGWFGINRGAQVCSTVSTVGAFVLLFRICSRQYGDATGGIACLFLLSSLSLLIHSKSAVYQFMPSTCAMIGLAYCLIDDNWDGLPLAGVLLAFCLLSGWIVGPMSVILIGLVAWLKFKEEWFLALLIIIPICLISIFMFESLYAWYFRVSIKDINLCLWDSYMSRFTQGSVPSAHLNLVDKFWYAFKCLFMDSTTFDHKDKILEGYPSIPFMFTGFFFIGLWKLAKK